MKQRLMMARATGALVAAVVLEVASAEQPDPECLADIYVLRGLAQA